MTYKDGKCVLEEGLERDMEAYQIQGAGIERDGYLAGIRGEPSSNNTHPADHWTGEVWHQGWTIGRENRVAIRGNR